MHRAPDLAPAHHPPLPSSQCTQYEHEDTCRAFMEYEAAMERAGHVRACCFRQPSSGGGGAADAGAAAA